MNSLRLFHKAKLAFNACHPQFYITLSHLCRQNIGFLKYRSELHALSNSEKSMKYISYCNLMLTESDSQVGNSDQEKFQKAVGDKEFQSILQDFAKDFGVDDEANKVLEDIRKNIDGSKTGKSVDSGNHVSCKVSGKTIDKSFPAKFKDFSESDASIIYSFEEEHDTLEESEPTYHVGQEFKPKMSYIDLEIQAKEKQEGSFY